jgi:hydrogenase maturation protease
VTAPLLVFAWGNASRGDDALGPLFVERSRELLNGSCDGRVEFLDDYQLQVEHALDLVGRDRVLFVDASLVCAAPFEASPLQAARESGFTSHALSPATVLSVFRTLYHVEPPPCTLLAIRGTRFELGEAPSSPALANLALALDWGLHWVADAISTQPSWPLSPTGLLGT